MTVNYAPTVPANVVPSYTSEREGRINSTVALGHDLVVTVTEFTVHDGPQVFTESRVIAFDADGNPLATIAAARVLTDATLTAAYDTARRMFPTHAEEAGR